MKLVLRLYKKFLCRIGWHSRFEGYANVGSIDKDPYRFLRYGTCKWCGFTGQIDSNGDLF